MTLENTALFGLPPEAIIKIQAIFAQYADVTKVILYGSRAKGTFRSSSDIDLCIEGKMLTLTQLLKIENELDDLLLAWKIDLSLKNKIDNASLLEHISKYGVVFYQR